VDLFGFARSEGRLVEERRADEETPGDTDLFGGVRVRDGVELSRLCGRGTFVVAWCEPVCKVCDVAQVMLRYALRCGDIFRPDALAPDGVHVTGCFAFVAAT
jgi:hypothetical protein